MSVAIRLDPHPGRPLRSQVCEECGTIFETTDPARRLCGAVCAGRREARRLADRHAAPRLRALTEDASPTIAAIYEVWRDHHARCATCGKYDWFDPGAPRLTAPGDLVASRRIRRPDGTEVGIVDGADVAVLCPNGRARFQNWVRAAMTGVRMGVVA